jgi:predicted acylesterase/phospholipase RssA
MILDETMPNAQIDSDDVGRRFCDLVMKGGITSGVVFPKAVARLSNQYRFRNIGGTSAGAIAAAGAAAAEYRRATDTANPQYGFAKLADLAEVLGERPTGEHSRLFSLFRPEPATRKHFAILAAMLNRGRATTRMISGILAAVRSFPFAALAGAVPGVILMVAVRGAAPINVVAIVIAVFVLVAGAMATAVAIAAVSLARILPKQEFGLATGHSTSHSENEPLALTDWLHSYLQDLAGKDSTHPLTFGDLDGVMLDASKDIQGINLEMMTTALSMGRPFALPFNTEQFYFSRAELERYFPGDVMAWMVANPGARSKANATRDKAMAALGFLPFPARATLPVVVAVRMSLSFPLLLAGVPLYRYAWEIEAAQQGDADDADLREDPRFAPANVRKVVFSDGGICSNFPVHMFDSVLPGWPTFGINLRDDLPASGGNEDRAYLPDRAKSLPPENYAIAQSGASAIISFATAIIKTMQNWRDNLQRAAPGFRDRIVTIRHTQDEGGLNLDMAARDIETMAASGQLGAEKLIAAFARPASLGADFLTYHRWVRIRSLLNVLQRAMREIHQGVTTLDNHPPYPDLVRDAPAYVGGSYRLSEPARSEAAKLLDMLDQLDHELEDARIDYAKTAPRPEVELRIQPVL